MSRASHRGLAWSLALSECPRELANARLGSRYGGRKDFTMKSNEKMGKLAEMKKRLDKSVKDTADKIRAHVLMEATVAMQLYMLLDIYSEQRMKGLDDETAAKFAWDAVHKPETAALVRKAGSKYGYVFERLYMLEDAKALKGISERQGVALQDILNQGISEAEGIHRAASGEAEAEPVDIVDERSFIEKELDKPSIDPDTEVDENGDPVVPKKFLN